MLFPSSLIYPSSFAQDSPIFREIETSPFQCYHELMTVRVIEDFDEPRPLFASAARSERSHNMFLLNSHNNLNDEVPALEDDDVPELVDVSYFIDTAEDNTAVERVYIS